MMYIYTTNMYMVIYIWDEHDRLIIQQTFITYSKVLDFTQKPKVTKLSKNEIIERVITIKLCHYTRWH